MPSVGSLDKNQFWPSVEIVTLSYNSSKFIAKYLEGIRGLTYPRERLSVTIVDNASQDDSVNLLKKVEDFPLHIICNKSNEGFARGNNQRLLSTSAEYIALLNIDTCVEADWLTILVEVMKSDLKVGICEARQRPREIDKYYDSVSHETSWCSGGGALIRRKAVQEVGGFDERLFMYGEDVDLSWRMWLSGWKCVYEPRAVYDHWTMEQDPGRDRSVEYFYCYRNGIYLRYFYAPAGLTARHLLGLFWKGYVVHQDNPLARRMIRCALRSHLSTLPFLLSRRRERYGRPHPWVQPRLWTYGWLASERVEHVRGAG